MRNILSALIFLSLTFVGCSSQSISTVVAPSVKTLGADELKRIVENDPDVLVIDVRTKGEIERDGAIKGFIHIPLSQVDKRLAEIPKDKRIIVACSHGARSARAASILLSRGYKDVYAAGMLEYMAKGYPLIYPKLAE